MADEITFYDEIEGYAGRLSCRPGEPMPIHVSTRADRYDVTVERWGGARLESPSGSAEGLAGAYTSSRHPTQTAAGCRLAGVVRGAGRRDDWASGFYLVTLRAHDEAAGPRRRPRRVRRAASTAPSSGRCWCWPPTPGMRTTPGAAPACTPAAIACPSAAPGPVACSTGPRSSATTARRGRCGSAKPPMPTARSSSGTASSTATARRSGRPAGSPTSAGSSSGPSGWATTLRLRGVVRPRRAGRARRLRPGARRRPRRVLDRRGP